MSLSGNLPTFDGSTWYATVQRGQEMFQGCDEPSFSIKQDVKSFGIQIDGSEMKSYAKVPNPTTF